MDTHYAPALEVEEPGINHGIPFSARLPGEPDPDAMHGADPLAGPEPLATPSVDPRNGNRKVLLGGAAVFGAAVLAGGAFLLTTYNHVVPVPAKVAAAVHQVGKSAGLDPNKPFAPAASLASVNLPDRPKTIVLPRYTPPQHGQDLSELLSIRPGSAAASGQDSAQSSSPKSAIPSQIAEAFIPHEPGSPFTPAIASRPPATSEVTAASKTVTAPVLPAAAVTDHSPQRTANTANPVNDQLPIVPHQDASAPSPTPRDPAAAASATQVVVPPDTVSQALHLHAGPMSSEEQVKVLELVTQMATIVRDLKTQTATLRADFAKTSAADQARLSDFARRIDMAEATNAVAAAKGAADAPVSPELPAENTVSVRQAMAVSPVAITRANVALPSSAPEAAKRFRVQAASPGLALLTEIARGGGDGAQIQVTVGEVIPGWGKVRSVAQRGTSWVVRTEHGTIE